MPRETPKKYREFEWPAGRTTELGAKLDALDVDLATVLRHRQSTRDFLPIALPQLGSLLWLVARTHSRRESPFGFHQQYRPYPSAGALHPIHLLCQRLSGNSWERYDPIGHVLVAIPGTESLADAARQSASRVIPTREATVLALVAEPGKTDAKYEHPESLVWRDAGVVLGYVSVVAEALNLAFCPLGLTGNNYIAPIATSGKLQGAGLAVLGAR